MVPLIQQGKMCYFWAICVEFGSLLSTGESRYIAGMGPATQKYNGRNITGDGYKTKIFYV